LPMNNLIT